jgi:hypothetical protein
MSGVQYVPIPESDDETVKEDKAHRRKTRGRKTPHTVVVTQPQVQQVPAKPLRSRSKSKKRPELRYIEQAIQDSDHTIKGSQSRSRKPGTAELRTSDIPLTELDTSEGHPIGQDFIDDEDDVIPDFPSDPAEVMTQSKVRTSSFILFDI